MEDKRDNNHRSNDIIWRVRMFARAYNGWFRWRIIGCDLFRVGALGHYRNDYPKVKNQNRGNKARVPDARGKAYVLGDVDANTGYLTLDTGNVPSQRSSCLHVYLNSEGTSETTNTVLRGYSIRIVRQKVDQEKKSLLSIISCEKAQKYMEKGCQLFLAQVTVKENKDESKEKRLEDVPTVRTFSEFFPDVMVAEDLPGLPPIRQVEFQIDLVLGAAPVARSARIEIMHRRKWKKCPLQQQELSDKGFYKTKAPHPWELRFVCQK
ncbi:hypothetical protein Tco_0411884 [Tanacetum coccineum]